MKIGHYQIKTDQKLAEGSEGTIYICKNEEELCAKVVEIRKDQSQKQLDILNKLKNSENTENLVNIKYFEYVESKQCIYIIMEKCQSTLKHELIKRKEANQGFSDQEIEDFLTQFIKGYSILYKQKILHRDIKPENILINYENGKLIYKLTDFGVSKVCDSNDLLMTQIGTPIYSPPEQYIGSKINANKLPNDDFPQSKRDVYSLGLILHQMMTGELPFMELKVKQFIKQIESTPFKMEKNYHNQQLIELVEKMIQYDPNQRISIPKLQEMIKNKTRQTQFGPNIFNLYRDSCVGNIRLSSNFNNNIQPQQNPINIINNNQFKEEKQLGTKQFEPILNTQNDKPFLTNNQQITQSQQQFLPINNGNFQPNNVNFQANMLNFQPIPKKTEQNQFNQILNVQLQTMNQQQVPKTSRERVQTECCSENVPQRQMINIVQTIKQYIEENHYDYFTKVDEIKKISFNLNQTKLSDEIAKQLISIVKFDHNRMDKYNLQTLQFQYCLRNYTQVNILASQDKKELQRWLRNYDVQ